MQITAVNSLCAQNRYAKKQRVMNHNHFSTQNSNNNNIAFNGKVASGIFGTFGGAAGAGIGFLFGGPLGAVALGSILAKIGIDAGETGSPAPYDGYSYDKATTCDMG